MMYAKAMYVCYPLSVTKSDEHELYMSRSKSVMNLYVLVDMYYYYLL